MKQYIIRFTDNLYTMLEYDTRNKSPKEKIAYSFDVRVHYEPIKTLSSQCIKTTQSDRINHFFSIKHHKHTSAIERWKGTFQTSISIRKTIDNSEHARTRQKTFNTQVLKIYMLYICITEANWTLLKIFYGIIYWWFQFDIKSYFRCILKKI